MYEKIDTLKYFCSPTTGIQLLFANMYLSKILEKANRILSGLFGGVFALLPLVVTENEFRIPVAVNGGINHDDITSMSSAQVSLISMIISIALLSQTSTKLNIIIGDEIDAPFDSENRREFITILYQLMSMVNASQCVLISHNSEIPMDDCDIILLKSDNDVITTGNIIWSYR
jgi:DNA repair exonuclease SbcCD ATPase subunit